MKEIKNNESTRVTRLQKRLKANQSPKVILKPNIKAFANITLSNIAELADSCKVELSKEKLVFYGLDNIKICKYKHTLPLKSGVWKLSSDYKNYYIKSVPEKFPILAIQSSDDLLELVGARDNVEAFSLPVEGKTEVVKPLLLSKFVFNREQTEKILELGNKNFGSVVEVKWNDEDGINFDFGEVCISSENRHPRVKEGKVKLLSKYLKTMMRYFSDMCYEKLIIEFYDSSVKFRGYGFGEDYFSSFNLCVVEEADNNNC
jgi:hypothetical protein